MKRWLERVAKRRDIESGNKLREWLAVEAGADQPGNWRNNGYQTMAKQRIISTTINGNVVEFLAAPRQTLLEVLRNSLDLIGTKEGCSNGNCGACTVLLDGRPVDSCLVLAVEVEGACLETIEGVAASDGLHVIQDAFLEQAALQCGICTPGFIMSSKALLDENASPTEEEIRFHLAGNLCRCTGYDKIVRAVQQAAEGETN